MHIFGSIEPNDSCLIEELFDSLDAIPVNIFFKEASRMVLQFIVEITFRVLREILCRRICIIQTVPLTTRANKEDILTRFQPKLVSQTLLLLILYLLIYFLFLLIIFLFSILKIMMFEHEIDYTMLAVNICTRVLYLDNVRANQSFLSVQYALHTAVTFPLFPIVISGEIRVNFSRRCWIVKLIFVSIFQNIQYFRSYSNAINGITDFQHQNH